MQHQHTRELISVPRKSHKRNNKRPESPTVTLTWHACKYEVHKLHQQYILERGCPNVHVRHRQQHRCAQAQDATNLYSSLDRMGVNMQGQGGGVRVRMGVNMGVKVMMGVNMCDGRLKVQAGWVS